MHEAGVGFAIKTGLVGKLSDLPKGIDLLMTHIFLYLSIDIQPSSAHMRLR